MVCDTYPQGQERLSELMLYRNSTSEKVSLGHFHSEPQYTKDIRCDLHPRWTRDGKAITFDSVHGYSRKIYIVDVSHIL